VWELLLVIYAHLATFNKVNNKSKSSFGTFELSSSSKLMFGTDDNCQKFSPFTLPQPLSSHPQVVQHLLLLSVDTWIWWWGNLSRLERSRTPLNHYSHLAVEAVDAFGFQASLAPTTTSVTTTKTPTGAGVNFNLVSVQGYCLRYLFAGLWSLSSSVCRLWTSIKSTFSQEDNQLVNILN